MTQRFIGSLLFNILFYLWTTLSVLLATPGYILGRRHISWAASLWGKGIQRLLKWCVGLDYEIRGREYIPASPSLIACKHHSAWETTVIHMLIPDVVIILKQELLWIPIFGSMVKGAGAIWIDRSKGKKVLSQLVTQATAFIRNNRSIFIFPEGTRRPVGAPPKYRYGILELYKNLNVPVTPVALNAGCFWSRRSFIKKPGKIIIEFMPPIEAGLPLDVFEKKLVDTIEKKSNALIEEANYTSSTKKKKGITLFLGVITLMMGIYTGGWFGASHLVQSQVNRLNQHLAVQGWTVNFDRMDAVGFPFKFGFKLKNLNAQHKTKILDIALQSDEIILYQHPFCPDKIHVMNTTTPLKFEVKYPLLTPLTGHIESINFSANPFEMKKELNLTLKQAHFNHAMRSLNVRFFSLQERGSMSPHQEQISHIQGRIEDLTFKPEPPFPLRPSIEKATFSFTTSPPLELGKKTSFYPSLKAWAQQGGTIDVNSLSLTTQGTEIELNGAFSFDDQLQPLITMALRVKSVEEGLQKLVQARLLAPAQKSNVLLALNLFKTPSNNTHQFSLSVQNQTLSVGPLPLMHFDPLPWSVWFPSAEE